MIAAAHPPSAACARTTRRVGLLTDAAVASVVVAGTGGFATEVVEYLLELHAGGGPAVAGCLHTGPGTPPPAVSGVPCLGTLAGYAPAAGQVAVVALGRVEHRRDAFERLRAAGLATPAFVAGPAPVSPSAVLDDGALVCPFGIVNAGARVGRGALLNVHCSVGHGATVGALSVLSPYAALNGGARAGEGCFLGTRATVYPGIAIGDGCVVDSHAGVRADAPDHHLISSRGTYLASPLRRPRR